MNAALLALVSTTGVVVVLVGCSVLADTWERLVRPETYVVLEAVTAAEDDPAWGAGGARTGLVEDIDAEWARVSATWSDS